MMSTYLIDIIILLIAAVIAVPFCQTVRLGAVPGFLIGGVIVGPYGLGLISKIDEIAHLAEIGVVFLLFVIGIELKPSRLWQLRKMVFGLGTLQVLVTGSIISAIAYFIFDIPLNATILIGPALALSSTAFVLQLLSEQKTLTTSFGRTSLSILLLQDLAVIPLLALIPLLAVTELSIGEDIGVALIESLFILLVIIVIGRYLLHPLLHRVALSGNPEVFTASAVLLVLGSAVITEHAGLSMAMGAFLAGLLISDSSYKHQIMAEIKPFRGLLLGLFFMSMGMSLNLALLVNNPTLSIGLIALLIAIKIIALFPLCYIFKISTKNSITTALILAQSGEFGLVLFSLAQQADLISNHLYQQLLLIILLSMLATPALSHFAHRIIRQYTPDKNEPDETPIAAPLVIAGYGRVGHRIGEILSQEKIPFVALDSDPLVVKEWRDKGHPVFYGDVRQPETLISAGVGNAEIIIITLNDIHASEQIVTSLHKSHPQTALYVRGHSLKQCQQLIRLGATSVVSENVEASLQLTRMALYSIGFSEKKLHSIIKDFSMKYKQQISDSSPDVAQ